MKNKEQPVNKGRLILKELEKLNTAEKADRPQPALGTPLNPYFISIDLDPTDDDFGKAIRTAQAAEKGLSRTGWRLLYIPVKMNIPLECKGVKDNLDPAKFTMDLMPKRLEKKAICGGPLFGKFIRHQF